MCIYHMHTCVHTHIHTCMHTGLRIPAISRRAGDVGRKKGNDRAAMWLVRTPLRSFEFGSSICNNNVMHQCEREAWYVYAAGTNVMDMYINTHEHVYANVNMYVCIYISVRIYISTCICMCMYVYMYMYGKRAYSPAPRELPS